MTADSIEDQIHNLVAAARMYYEQDLSQDEIAKALGKSRPTVSRMLAAARKQGIVHIEIRPPLTRLVPLERALQERFRLEDARVVRSTSGEPDTADHLGRAAANYLQSVLRDGMALGVSNGRSLAATARFLQPELAVHINVVQIIGALGHDNPAIDGPDVARAFATAYDATCRYLHVPILVESPVIKQTLMRDRNIAQTLRVGANVDVAVVGVGTLDPTNQSPIFEGLITQKDIVKTRQAGGIGHICGEFYTATGARVQANLNDRTISIGLDAMKRIPKVIAVAGGASKATAIVAGLRGGYFNTLITDDRAAERMLRMTPVR
ncbi:sugar-binding transcriptional regulator [Amycolatopsis balhimycina DSM 5908]|uniref:Sugar-binding transcriptional regulator n=1 Tax=Amycolatopsis balhimycina DSM 5908 TaxID=1081091 RepID=A0A428WB84_AMYBA|nr:sugar-binding transcriptional regulator [Amycolatopsis balhimycina]RSM40368.1 sugar-binding transcriptional regulator [Amycolatopsis balhimycina DSM 5908]